MQSHPPVALTIAGSDSGGGAGIQADLLSFAANGAFGTSAITCLTAQNPNGVSAIEAMPPAFVSAQLDQLAAYFYLAAIKTGMLFNSAIIHAVADFLDAHPSVPCVVDPVMVATSGAVLLEPDAIDALRSRILPRATLITPNLDEVKVLLGHCPTSVDEMRSAARALRDLFGAAVLVKGGHLPQHDMLTDVLLRHDGDFCCFESNRIGNVDTHGSGCTLSSAIAAQLAHGKDLPIATAEAIAYLQRGMRQPVHLNGRPFIRH